MPLIVDNTVPTPYLIRPIEHGADIVVHSATKYLGGHGTAIGGVIVDSGNFDWVANAERFPNFNTPDPSYNNLTWGVDLGPDGLFKSNVAFIFKARLQGLRDIGPGHLAVQRLPDLAGRRDAVAAHRAARRQRDQGRRVAQRPRRGRRRCPTPGWSRARGTPNQLKYAPLGGGAIVAFEIKGGVEAGQTFTDALELFTNLANIGDVRSLVIHPASTTHAQLSPAEQLTTGVTPGLIRLAVGIEHIDDILADLEAGFRAAKGE